jgi:hypothetical protein
MARIEREVERDYAVSATARQVQEFRQHAVLT